MIDYNKLIKLAEQVKAMADNDICLYFLKEYIIPIKMKFLNCLIQSKYIQMKRGIMFML